MSDRRPIGIFDSGIGGLTVLNAIGAKLPNESLIYFGDTLHFPYGDKSSREILNYATNIAHYLFEMDIKALVIACNTATAYSLDILSEMSSIPVIGVIDPGVKKALRQSSSKEIAVIGTKGTIRSQAYQKSFAAKALEAKIYFLETPLLAPLAEKYESNSSEIRYAVEMYLQQIPLGDTLLLGCTHYPLLRGLFEEILEKRVQIVDSAESCSEEVASLLKEKKIETDVQEKSLRYIVSDNPEVFQKKSAAFFGHKLFNVQKAEFLKKC